MSNTIQPWIKTYLVYLAETYGGNLMGMPQEPKNKKFLTPHVVGKEGWVWVVVSDKFHKIPARLSKEAVKTFEAHPRFQGKSLSGYKTAVLGLKQFRPVFTRIPGPNGMKPESQLVLDVDRFELKGCFGEAVYGSPRAVEHDEGVREWSEGLRNDGGGGYVRVQAISSPPAFDPNVLKIRKEERAKAAQTQESEAGPSKETPRKRVLPSLLTQKVEVSAPPAKNRESLNRVSKHSVPNALDMSTPPPSPKQVQHKHNELAAEDEVRPTTPSQWTSSVHPSQPSSPVPMDVDDADDKADTRSDDGSAEDDFNMASSPPGAPGSVSSQEDDLNMASSPPGAPGSVSSQEDDFDIRSTPHRSPGPAAEPPLEEQPMSVEEDWPEQHGDERKPTKDEHPEEAEAEASSSFRLLQSSPEHQARIRSQPLDSPLHEPDSPSQSKSAPRSSSLPAANQAFVASQDQGSVNVGDSPQAPPNWRRFIRPFKVPFEPGRVLVPNSDSSQSQSHSQSHTHSQSLTQSQSQSQTQLLSQAPVFSSQIPQSQDYEGGPPLTGPQQSLSYTSQPQSQSQASKESQKDSLPVEEAEDPHADADKSNEVSLEDVRPEEKPKTELHAQEVEPTREEPMDVDVDEDTGVVDVPEAEPMPSGPQGPASAVGERNISPEILDGPQDQRSSPPSGDDNEDDEDANASDSAEVQHTRSSPPAPPLDEDDRAESDDQEAQDESDELPDSSVEESDEAEDEEGDEEVVNGAEVGEEVVNGEEVDWEMVNGEEVDWEVVDGGKVDGEAVDGEKADDEAMDEEVMDRKKVVDDDGDEDEEVLEALAMEHDVESDEEDELDQEAVSREEEEGLMKAEEEEEEERVMVKEEEEESTQSQLGELKRGVQVDSVDRKNHIETKAVEADGLSSDDAQTQRKLRRSNDVAKRSERGASGSSASPLILTHNVLAWQKPTFQRNLEQAGAHKRPASSSPGDGGKAVKKRRRQSPRPDTPPSRQVPKPVASSSKAQRRTPHNQDAIHPTSPKIQHVDLSVAASSALAGKVKAPRGSVGASSSGTIDSASKVKHMDFGPAISTQASKKGKEKANPQASADTTSVGIYRSRSAASRSSSFKPTADAQNGQSNGLNTNTLSRLKTTHTPRGKFGGYKLDLSMTSDADGPSLVTWKALTDILLRTGKARHQESKQKEHAGDP
ncbi:hypothetical protein EIP86_005066 [Pleurotus ostreatoroseus]|nr:hypothetical protein EIP86_005066 [Pleurotus ostreatoroseus]